MNSRFNTTAALKRAFIKLSLLTQHFSEELAPKLKRSPLEFNKTDLSFFNKYNWLGNVRELKNVVERSLLLNRSFEEYY